MNTWLYKRGCNYRKSRWVLYTFRYVFNFISSSPFCALRFVGVDDLAIRCRNTWCASGDIFGDCTCNENTVVAALRPKNVFCNIVGFDIKRPLFYINWIDSTALLSLISSHYFISFAQDKNLILFNKKADFSKEWYILLHNGERGS